MSWSPEQTEALLSLWSEGNIQRELAISISNEAMGNCQTDCVHWQSVSLKL